MSFHGNSGEDKITIERSESVPRGFKVMLMKDRASLMDTVF